MKRFLNHFTKDNQTQARPITCDVGSNTEIIEFLSRYNGTSFNRGQYRLLGSYELEAWTKIVQAAFPTFSDILCFGYDWLGRFFAMKPKNSKIILMFDVDTGNALEIPATFIDFHNIELVDYANEALAQKAFDEWAATQEQALGRMECVSYKIPLHLGGNDELSNRKRVDLQVHWELGAQILDQLAPLTEGDRISEIRKIIDPTFS